MVGAASIDDSEEGKRMKKNRWTMTPTKKFQVESLDVSSSSSSSSTVEEGNE